MCVRLKLRWLTFHPFSGFTCCVLDKDFKDWFLVYCNIELEESCYQKLWSTENQDLFWLLNNVFFCSNCDLNMMSCEREQKRGWVDGTYSTIDGGMVWYPTNFRGHWHCALWPCLLGVLHSSCTVVSRHRLSGVITPLIHVIKINTKV